MGKIINDFDLRKQARELGLSVWQTPSFLFLLMGIIIIVVMASIYLIYKNNESPEILIMSEIITVTVIFVIGNFIIKNLEVVARANKSKSEFVSMASHQLKTPLAGASWGIELLISKYGKSFNDDQMRIIGDIEKSNEKMARLVNDFLDVARIEQDNFFLREDRFDLVSLVSAVIESNRVPVDNKKIKLEMELGRGAVEIAGDKSRMKVVVDNLISNAVKYVRKNGKIKIGIEKKEGEAVFRVKDNGVGIPERQQRRIFEKFFRSDNALKEETTGTGLGLYIAKNIIEQSGGKLWFVSIEGSGSEFCFSIPIKSKGKV